MTEQGNWQDSGRQQEVTTWDETSQEIHQIVEPQESLREPVQEPPPETSPRKEAPTPRDGGREAIITSEPGPEPVPEPTPEKPVETTPEPITCPAGSASQEPLDSIVQWGSLPVGKGPQPGQLSACGVQGFRVVGAATAEFEVHVKDFPATAQLRLTVYNARRANKVAQDKPLTQVQSQGKGWLVGKFQMDHTGEVSLVVDALTHPLPVSYRIEIFCIRNCHLQATRFPLVLMHGFAGTDKYFGILTYFYQVKADLEQKGYAVFTPTVQPIANSTQRVKTLKGKIDDILQQTGARKLNLIAHSQGGVDGRLLISLHKYGDRIASLTTISTPHRGIPVPNLLLPPSQELGEANMQKYNQTYPDDPRVAYFSWAGVSCRPLDRACRQKHSDEVVDPLLLATYITLQSLRGDNDGIVPVSSAKWGKFLGLLPADHFDEIGQIADRNNKSFQHKAFFLQEAQRLAKLDF